jgi:hypothetical protein
MRSKSNISSIPAVEPMEPRVLFSTSFLSQLTATPTVTGSTIPGNGDVNPYGVAFVPSNAAGGKLVAGDVLVSNFNSSTSGQGAGTTIVEINPKTGAQKLFFQGQPGLGLTTALGVLPGGFVLVGNVPQSSTNASLPNGPGSLLIINKNGQVVKTLVDSKLLDGPWDLTVVNYGLIQTVFVSNVLNGTVTRLDFLDDPFGFGTANQLLLIDKTRVASGYQFGLNSAAFVVGPTGLAFNQSTNTLYVASTEDNAIYAVGDAAFSFPHSGTGRLVFSSPQLRGPLALGFAPNGDLLTANGDAFNADTSTVNPQNSEIVEFTPGGQYVTEFQIDPAAGGAFGFALEQVGSHSVFAAVDDNTNSLDIWDV